MGSYFSANPQPKKVLMQGLDGAGKTTILYKFTTCQVETLLPSIGFCIERIKSTDIWLYSWDVGGEDKPRALWKPYYKDVHGLIFVIDCQPDCRKYRFDEMVREFKRFMETEELKGLPVLIFANKQDFAD